MRLDVLDGRESLEESVRSVFQAEPTPRHTAFFLAVSMVVDLYRFRHEGPVASRREEALRLLKEQVHEIGDSAKYKFSEDDDLARRALMFAHKCDITALLSQGQAPDVGVDGFDQEADLSTTSLNSHLSYIRRQYLFDGILKVAAFYGS